MSLVLNKYYSGVGPVANLGLQVAYVFDASEGSSGVYRPMAVGDFGGSSSDSVVSGEQGSQTGIGGIFTENSARSQIFIQNVGTEPIFVALGSVATPTNYNMILPGGAEALDGNGGSWSANNWKGTVSVSGSNIAYTRFEY